MMDKEVENLCNLVSAKILKNSKHKYFLTQEEYEKNWVTLSFVSLYRRRHLEMLKWIERDLKDGLERRLKE